MSRLILIRHAQASFSADPSEAFLGYDRLSELGKRQAEALGEELAAAGLDFDRVYTGPARRQRETADAVGEVYRRRNRPWPEPVVREGLQEHDGAGVVRRALHAAGYEKERERLDLELRDGGGRRAYFTAFRTITRLWARGELPEGLVDESWQSFRARVRAELETILAEAGRGETLVAFTSGGPIGSTVADVLGLGDEAALEFAWTVENATLTELLFTLQRVSLKSFNAQPRTGAPELVTHV